MKYASVKCPCCGNHTLKSDQNGHVGEICEVCLWQSDENQDIDPDLQVGLNPVSLNEAKNNYKQFGAIILAYMKYARKPKKEEIHKIDYYELIAEELFDKHCLAALVICIDAGNELDFHYNEISYGITWTNGNEKLQLSSIEMKEVQEFKNCTDLVFNGTIEGKKFIDIWDDLILDLMS